MGIIIKNVSFSYESKMVLKDIDLHVRTGESVGIVGVSGGGKSTLLKLIAGLYDVQTGVIQVMDAFTPEKRRRNIAMVMQNISLFPASIRDNITCGHDYNDNEVRYACEAAKLMEWIETLTEGIDTFVGERGGKVSGGQAQRIAIARAIVKNAPVILLDEPTSALDIETGDAVMDALARLTKGKTVLHVSHKMETLAGYDKVLRLESGRFHV
jgi:ATP-binding cassette subfamily B protein/subfamily B ATP-binding cassette protein MsbA